MPRPPPPAVAFRITGYLILLAIFLPCSTESSKPYRAGNARHAGLNHGGFGRSLVAHLVDHLGRSPDELDAVFGADARKFRVFRQKAVAGVNGVGVGDFGGRNQGGDIQVGLGAGGRADAHGLVGERTCRLSLSAVEYTATVLMPISLQVRIMRRAISPRLAMSIFLNIRWFV